MTIKTKFGSNLPQVSYIIWLTSEKINKSFTQISASLKIFIPWEWLKKKQTYFKIRCRPLDSQLQWHRVCQVEKNRSLQTKEVCWRLSFPSIILFWDAGFKNKSFKTIEQKCVNCSRKEILFDKIQPNVHALRDQRGNNS